VMVMSMNVRPQTEDLVTSLAVQSQKVGRNATC